MLRDTETYYYVRVPMCMWKGLTPVEIHVPEIENYAPLNRHEQRKWTRYFAKNN